MKVFKRLLSVMLCVVMVLQLSVTVFTTGAAGDFQYVVEDDKVTITKYVGTSQNVTVPALIEGCPVTAIGDGAFFMCSGILSIELPDSIVTIGKNAFKECLYLKSIQLPQGLTELGEGAFILCQQLEEITIPSGVQSIRASTFSGCYQLNRVNLPSELSSIENNAFATCCKLEKITLPQGVTKISDAAFSNCEALKEIYLMGDVVSIGNRAFVGCEKLKTLSLPQTVKTIGDSAFKDCSSLATLLLPDTVESIGEAAFSGCTVLENVRLTNVVSIGKQAFEYCGALTKVEIGNKLESLGEDAFQNCRAITEVTVLGNGTVMENGAFQGCENLTRVTLGAGVAEIGDLFSGCRKLKDIQLADVPMKIASNAFNNTEYYRVSTNWKNGLLYIDKHLIRAERTVSGNINIKNGTLSIAGAAFSQCVNITSVNFPNSLAIIGDSAFKECSSLTAIRIPDNVVRIGDSAFTSCSGVTVLEIGNGITEIPNNAFSFCAKLTGVRLGSQIKAVGFRAFYSCGQLKTLELSEGLETIGPWAFRNNGISELVLPDSVSLLDEQAFAGCSSLKSVTFGKGIKEIDVTIFDSATSLERIEVAKDHEYLATQDGVLFNKAGTTLIFFPCKKGGEYTVPQGVTAIGAYAFYSTPYLTSVKMPNSVTTLGEGAFYYCKATSIEISEQIKVLPAMAFGNCAFTEIKLPETLEEIGEKAFYGCAFLKTVELPSKVRSLGNNAFDACFRLEEIHLNEGLVSIGNSCFSGTVKHIDLPDSVVSIDDYAFRSCQQLVSLRIGTNVTSIGRYPVAETGPFGCLYYAGNQEEWKALKVTFPHNSVTIHYGCDPEFKDVSFECGFLQRHCALCNKKLYATGEHIADGKWVVQRPSTVTRMGKKVQYCKKCGSVAKEEAIPLLPDVYRIFSDVNISDWFYKNKSIRYVYYNNLFQGTSATTFSPNAAMTRGMFVTVLGRLHGVSSSHKTTKFADVKKSVYYSGYVKWASDNGIVTGTSVTTFAPEANITREQICAIMMRYCNYADIALKQINQQVTFEDAKSISGYAKKAVRLCQQGGIVGGEKTDTGHRFRPQGNATRAEVATIIMNFSQNYL